MKVKFIDIWDFSNYEECVIENPQLFQIGHDIVCGYVSGKIKKIAHIISTYGNNEHTMQIYVESEFNNK